VTELPFFATKVRLGRRGAEEVYQLGPLNEYERYEETFNHSTDFPLLVERNKQKN
jgi:hypothetical protein